MPMPELLRDSKQLCYPSMEAAIEDLIQMIPILASVRQIMEENGDDQTLPEQYLGILRAMEFLTNPSLLRKTLSKCLMPDGKVAFSFTSEAWDCVMREMSLPNKERIQ